MGALLDRLREDTIRTLVHRAFTERLARGVLGPTTAGNLIRSIEKLVSRRPGGIRTRYG